MCILEFFTEQWKVWVYCLNIKVLYAGCNINRGGWDTEGVTTISVADNTITCNSNHLTSFAVLVDVAGGHGVCNIVFLL